MSSDWDYDEEEKEDQSKREDKDKDSDKKTPQTNPRFFAEMTLTLQPPKPSITEYFGKTSNVIPIMNAWEEECRHDTITKSQEHQNYNTLVNIY